MYYNCLLIETKHAYIFTWLLSFPYICTLFFTYVLPVYFLNVYSPIPAIFTCKFVCLLLQVYSPTWTTWRPELARRSSRFSSMDSRDSSTEATTQQVTHLELWP